MLHSKKSQSILQWFNSLTTKEDVSSIEQFTDGSHFYDIVVSMQPFLLHDRKESNLSGESVIFSETSIACNEEVTTSVEKETAEGNKETSVSDSGNDDPFVIKESDQSDSQKKYDVVRKFINDFYHLDSFVLIDYEECQKGKELELAKVAVFLLSAMVQNLLAAKEELAYNITLLEHEVQVNIHECMALVLGDKEGEETPIKKSELHKILSRGANIKATQLRNQRSRSQELNDSLEGAKQVSRKRKDRASVVAYEDPQDSPLKNLLESPKIQYKAALLKKQSEMSNLRSALYDEENKVSELTFEKQNMQKALMEKDKQLELKQQQLDSLREVLNEKEEQEKLRTEELKNKKIEEERFKKRLQCHEEEIKQLKKENEALQEKALDLEKRLEHRPATSLGKENESLRDQIHKLDVDNEKKDEEIKGLNEQIRSLKSEFKSLQDEIQELPNTKIIKEFKSQNAETLSTILYVANSETSERREQEPGQDLDNKDERKKAEIKLSTHQGSKKKLSKWEFSKVETSEHENVESLQKMVENLCKSEARLKEENKTLKKTLQAYEAKFGSLSDISITRELNSIKNEIDKIGLATDNISDDRESIQLAISFVKTSLQTLIRHMEKKKWIPSSMVKPLRENCKKIKDIHGIAARLRDLVSAVEHFVTPSVTTRSRVAAEEVDSNSLTGRNKDFEKENETLKSLKCHQNKLNKKMEELSKAKEDLEKLQNSNEKLAAEVESLQQKNENLQQELANTKEKYINMEKLAKKKDDDVKRTLIMYQRIVKNDKKDKESKKECGEECEKLRKRCKKLNDECVDFEQEATELKRSIKNLEGMMEHLQFEIKELKTKNKELQQKLWEETSALSRNTTDRDALVFHYLKKSKHEPKKSKDQDLKKEEQKKFSRPIVKVDAYILNSDNEPSMSNSMLAGRSIRSSYFQVADEDDFLNESSLAEIHNMGNSGGESAERRLLEIQRRNTLCLPHLQSSYPLEIQNMTPSEKKYYNPEEVSYDLSRRSSMYGKRDIHRKLKSKYVESDSGDSDDSHSFPVKRLKVAETDHASLLGSKKKYQPSYGVVKRTSKDQGIQRKPSTPLKQVAAYVKKRSTFKTPLAVQRLMASSKNKMH